MADYSKLTHNSPFAIKRFSHRTRFKYYGDFLSRNKSVNLNPKFLDYGTGDGHIFNYLKENDINDYLLFAYEPVESQFVQLSENVENNDLNVVCLRELGERDKYDIVLCAEVLEHFSALNVISHLSEIRKILNDNGRLLISVPIEIGAAGVAKNLVRTLLGQKHNGLSLSVLLKSFFDEPIHRGNDFYISSHVGFSYKKLEYLIIESGYKIEKKYFSPLPVLRSFINAQVFFECSME